MLEKLIPALQSLDLDPTAEELADVLWLALQMRQSPTAITAIEETSEKLPTDDKLSTSKPKSLIDQVKSLINKEFYHPQKPSQAIIPQKIDDGIPLCARSQG